MGLLEGEGARFGLVNFGWGALLEGGRAGFSSVRRKFGNPYWKGDTVFFVTAGKAFNVFCKNIQAPRILGLSDHFFLYWKGDGALLEGGRRSIGRGTALY